MGSDYRPDRHPTSSNSRAKNPGTLFVNTDATRSCAVLSAIGIVISSGLAMTPRFYPTDVVRQVHHARSKPSACGREPLSDGGEFLIDTSVTLLSAPDDQLKPAAAFDGTEFLVVWEDDRDGSFGYNVDIYGARMTRDGVLLDTCNIPIARAPNVQEGPAAAFDGANFFVVWQDHRRGEYDIYGARVTPAGEVLDPSGIPICLAVANQYAPDVVFDGTDFFVVWRDYRNGTSFDIYGARVTSGGSVLDSEAIAISTAPRDQMEPAIAFDGTNSLVLWQDERAGDRDIYGARITSCGEVLDTSGIPVSRATGYQSCPVVAFDGIGYLAAWIDARNGGSCVYGARITTTGSVLDSTGFGIPFAGCSGMYPSVAFDGTDFVVAWQKGSTDSFDIYAARVAPDGVVLDSTGIVVSNTAADEWYPAVATDGTSSVVAWGGLAGDFSCGISCARVSSSGVLLDTMGIEISKGANVQSQPDVASDGQDFLVVWADARGADGDIYGARITQAGAVLDPAGIDLSPTAGHQSSPAVAFDGANYFVVWEEGTGIFGTRVTSAGVVLDTPSVHVSWGGRPDVSFDGTNFLVAWERWYGGQPSDIYAARVAPAGVVLDTAGIAVSQAWGYEYTASVACDGVNALVVWTEQQLGSNFDIYGARVTPDGEVLDPDGIPIGHADGYKWDPAIDFDGTYYLVAWTDERGRHYGDTSDIFGARVTPAGVVLDPQGIHIGQAEHAQVLPDVAAESTGFAVVWEDQRSGWYEDIYGARVSQSGVVSDVGQIAEQEGRGEQAALARTSGGQFFLAYQGWAGTVGGKAYNIYRTWGKLGPLLGVAEATLNAVERGTNPGPTVVRGVLLLEDSPSSSTDCLMDATGRKVMDLKLGANDVRALVPGVYFIRQGLGTRGEVPGKTRKVVVTR